MKDGVNDDRPATGRQNTGPERNPAGAGPQGPPSSGSARSSSGSAGSNANTLGRWTEAVTSALGIDGPIDRDLILNLTKDVAHGVARPAAPLTAYLLGLAVGAGADPVDCAARLSRMAGHWAEPPASG